MAAADAAAPVRGAMDGEKAFLASGQFASQQACALRELFEEAGILSATGPAPDEVDLEAARAGLLDGGLDFADWLVANGLALDASRLRFAGRWVTPPLSPIRFDATFFLMEWPPGEASQPSVIPGELTSGEWIRPADALDRWMSGDVLVAHPTLETLRVLADDGPEGRRRLWRSEAGRPDSPRVIEFRPAVRAIPLRTRTLPPATHTNTLLLGGAKLILVDPGASDQGELERLCEIVDEVSRETGGHLTAVILTHHHADHVDGAGFVRQHYAVPVWAHEATAARLADRDIDVDRCLRGGETIETGGSLPLRIRMLHTPGHASGHLCLFEERCATLLCGDMLSGYGSVVINPPDGNMADYLDSLERLSALGARVALPSHGSMFPDAAKALRDARDHRLWREGRVLDAWNSGLRDPDRMVAPVYGELESPLRLVAARQVLAHLERLDATGRIAGLPREVRESLGKVVESRP